MECFYVDTFTNAPLTGNPTVVCIDLEGMQDDVMQKIAVETNQTETVFLSRVEEGDLFSTADQFNLRWFSPTCEVRLCGHGTMAAAVVLFQVLKNPNTSLNFNTLSGTLRTVYNRDNDMVDLTLPLMSCDLIDRREVQELVKLSVGNLPVSECQYSKEALKLLICLEDSVSRHQLEETRPYSQEMMGVNQSKVKGVIVTVKANEDDREYDFFSRYFTPWYGNPEDSVTGAAHTVLGPYWSRKLNRETMKARQCSSRGGDLLVHVDWEGSGCVILTGGCRVVICGKMNV